ncbi:hypothetical protein N8Z32_02045 [Ascidiaceihabitans sp.]|nr:hypothetical protein [Ascidiaceihabitans sp.]
MTFAKRLFATVVLIWSANCAFSEEKQKVLWGGLGLSSAFDAPLAPVASTLLTCVSPDEVGRCPIEVFALEAMLNADFDKVELQRGYAESNVSYLFSPIIDAEWVSHVVLAEGDDRYVYQFLILGSALIYEVESGNSQLLSSVPISLYATRYFSKPLSTEEQNDIFEEMYLGTETYNGQKGFYNIFYNMAEQASSKSDAPLTFPGYVKFTGVGFSDGATSALARDFDLDSLTQLMSSWATANLADATDKMIIPSTFGQNQLRLVFRNAEMRLILPEPLYEFDMYVQAVETYKNSNFTCFDVAAYYGVKNFDDMLLDAPIQHGEDSCAFLKSGTAEANPIYVANLLSQIQKVMFSFSNDPADLNDLQSNILTDKSGVTSSIKKIKQDIFYAN